MRGDEDMNENQLLRTSHLSAACILRRLLRECLLILAAGLTALMLSITAMDNLHRDEYAASTTLAVSVKSSAYSSVLSNLSASTEIANTFTKLFESNMFGSVAASSMGVERLPGTLKATVLPETNLLTLRVTASSPEDAFRTLKLMLENYGTLSEHVFQNVVLKELQGPTMPTAPSNPLNRDRVMKLAFLGGAGAMVALLLAIAVLSDTVQTTAAVGEKLDMKLFATLHHEAKNKTLRTKLRRTNKGLLITMPVASFHFTEEIHKLSMKLSNVAASRGHQVILVTSVAENEGKSTVAANLALSLAQGGKRVLLMDADLHKAAQYKLLDHQPQGELADMLAGTVPYQPEFLPKEGLSVLFSKRSSGQAAELVASEGMHALLDQARGEMDFIIIDSPPTAFFSDVEALTDLVDASLLVVRQDCVSARHINDAADLLTGGRAELLGCVFNDVWGTPFSSEHHSYGYGSSYGYGYTQRPERAGEAPQGQGEEEHGRT